MTERMVVRYECKLSPKVIQKAVEELNEPEDHECRLQAIDKLRDRFLAEVCDVDSIRKDDAFILRFLRYRKFNEDRALKSLKNYHHLRTVWRDVFNLVESPELIDSFLDIGSVVPVRGRAKDGTFISIGRPGRNFGKNDGIIQFIAATILSTERILENEESQIYGITVIQDLRYFGIGLSFQMTVVARQFINLMQDALPIRIKNLSVVNESVGFDIIFRVLRPFMKDKLSRRMELHGTQRESLRNRIDPDILPPFLGGTGPEQDVVGWKSQIFGSSSFW